MTKDEILNELEKVGHPAINHSLIKLGIVTDAKLNGSIFSVVFAFPFPNIPIAEMLINSIAQPVISFGLEFDYKIRVMNEDEKARFLKLEAEAWKG